MAALLDAEGWRNCLASPIGSGDDVVGVLCTYNRTGLEGFEDGEVAVLGALADDIVQALDKSRLLQEVLDERTKLAEIVGNTSDGIVTLATDGTVTSWNPALEAITGWRAAEVIGTTKITNLRPRDGEDRDVLIEHWATTKVDMPAVVQIITRAGEPRWLSCSYTRVAEGEHGPGSLIVVARDVTSAHELERLKEDFVATVSHELRTPLAPIKGWATTLLEHGERLNEDQRREAHESILRHSQRLERLIINLLEASKIEHGRSVDANEQVDVTPVVNRVVDTFKAGAPDRLFVLDGVDAPVPARGNELWIEQILTNLVSNAPQVLTAVHARGGHRRPPRHGRRGGGHRLRAGHPLLRARAHLRPLPPPAADRDADRHRPRVVDRPPAGGRDRRHHHRREHRGHRLPLPPQAPRPVPPGRGQLAPFDFWQLTSG